jgi:hypothetical protein
MQPTPNRPRSFLFAGGCGRLHVGRRWGGPGYDWIRAWCEIFTETELLQGVTQRYQPNVRMTNLAKIKAAALPEAVATVNRVPEGACRYIDGHAQPLVTLGVARVEGPWPVARCRR